MKKILTNSNGLAILKALLVSTMVLGGMVLTSNFFKNEMNVKKKEKQNSQANRVIKIFKDYKNYINANDDKQLCDDLDILLTCTPPGGQQGGQANPILVNYTTGGGQPTCSYAEMTARYNTISQVVSGSITSFNLGKLGFDVGQRIGTFTITAIEVNLVTPPSAQGAEIEIQALADGETSPRTLQRFSCDNTSPSGTSTGTGGSSGSGSAGGSGGQTTSNELWQINGNNISLTESNDNVYIGFNDPSQLPNPEKLNIEGVLNFKESTSVGILMNPSYYTNECQNGGSNERGMLFIEGDLLKICNEDEDNPGSNEAVSVAPDGGLNFDGADDPQVCGSTGYPPCGTKIAKAKYTVGSEQRTLTYWHIVKTASENNYPSPVNFDDHPLYDAYNSNELPSGTILSTASGATQADIDRLKLTNRKMILKAFAQASCGNYYEEGRTIPSPILQVLGIFDCNNNNPLQNFSNPPPATVMNPIGYCRIDYKCLGYDYPDLNPTPTSGP